MKTTTLKKHRKYLGIVYNVLFWVLIICIYFFSQQPRDLIVFLDVGQGDSTLIQNGDTQILIDGGPDRSVLYELPKYMPFFDRKIEYLILTHPHDDHLVGLLHVLENYEVGEVLYYPVCYTNANYETLISNSVKKRIVSAGKTIRLDSLDINIIWPIETILVSEDCYKPFDNNINNDSLVLDIQYKSYKFLLMGDAEEEVEENLLSRVPSLSKYDVLKAGHHCSKTSTSETFLKMVSPAYAICPCGYKNKFGHPSSETLDLFSKYGVQYMITYTAGNIVFDTEDMPKL